MLQKKMLLWVLGIAVAIQFIRPDFHNHAVDASVALRADAEVTEVLVKACYDCHSDSTSYPWYSNIAPLSWVMANHINRGRMALNFSEWEKIDPKVRLERLERAGHLLHIGRMPVGSYVLMHERADLTEAQKDILRKFFSEQMEVLKAEEVKSVAKR